MTTSYSFQTIWPLSAVIICLVGCRLTDFPESATTNATTGASDSDDEPPPSCGDGMVNSPLEECDDGKNGDQDDGCTDKCTLPACGDGYTQPSLGEECDDPKNSMCDKCMLKGCGDRIVQDGEECDDGNKSNGDGCSALCKDECGDGVTQTDEECDDGNLDNEDSCLSNCTPNMCGDGYLNSEAETCDDGEDNGNGSYNSCNADCSGIEHICGDGHTDAPDEVCDDGDNNSNDDYGACRKDCSGRNSCGDGETNGPEECDNGADNGEGQECSEECHARRYVFVTSVLFTGDLVPVGDVLTESDKEGLLRGDDYCNTLADDGNLPGSYAAWLSDINTSAGERISGLLPPGFSGAFALPANNTLVALNWSTFTVKNLQLNTPINLDETGQNLPNTRVWTGTDSNGNGTQHDCAAWMSSDEGPLGTLGSTLNQDSGWTNSLTSSCAIQDPMNANLTIKVTARVYCFQVTMDRN